MRCYALIFMGWGIWSSCQQVPLTVKAAVVADTSPTWLLHGLPLDNWAAQEAVAKQYGFKFKSVAGCVASDRLLDSVSTVNRRVDSLLQLRFGKDWRIDFDEQVDSVLGKSKPQYPGGPSQWRKYIASHLEMPERCDASFSSAAIRFLVDTTGMPSEISILYGDPAIEKTLIDLVRQSGPWIPAMQDGRAAYGYKTTQFTYCLREE